MTSIERTAYLRLKKSFTDTELKGYYVPTEDLNFISPARYAHINPYGRYYFNIEENLNRKGLRSLREKKPQPELNA